MTLKGTRGKDASATLVIEMERETDRQTDRQTDTDTDRQTDTETHTEAETERQTDRDRQREDDVTTLKGIRGEDASAALRIEME